MTTENNLTKPNITLTLIMKNFLIKKTWTSISKKNWHILHIIITEHLVYVRCYYVVYKSQWKYSGQDMHQFFLNRTSKETFWDVTNIIKIAKSNFDITSRTRKGLQICGNFQGKILVLYSKRLTFKDNYISNI